jgi:hypothetical protein
VVSFDLSKALPPRAYLYFSAFMPGLFLEISILLANPALARELALRSQEGFGFGRYLTLSAALFLAFVIGNALMALASLIQMAVGYTYSFCLRLWETFEKRALLPVLTKLTHIQPTLVPNAAPRSGWTPPKWVSDLYIRTLSRATRRSSTQPTEAYLWWIALAKQLLQKRYGLTEEDLPQASFSPLQDVLTTPTPEEIRGSILVNALHATGWAALIASRFAPILRTRWYIASAAFLMAYGLLHDWYVAKHLRDPGIGDTARLLAVLREFPKLQAGAPSHPAPENKTDIGPEH